MNKFSEIFKNNYIMPREQKNTIAVLNAKRLIKVEIALIIFSFVTGIFKIISNLNDLRAEYPTLAFYTGFFITGVIGLFLCLFVLKKPNLKPSVKMIPLQFTLLGITFFNLYALYFDHEVFSAFIIFACTSTITPVLFKIEPLFFNSVITLGSVFLCISSYNGFGIYSILDICLFTFFCSILSIFIWKNVINDYILNKNLEEYKLKMEHELQLAAVVQESFFKHEENIYDKWAIAFYSKPMSGVSGDFFDIYHTDNILDGIGLFDVSGHGISSGLVTMLVKNIINQEFYKGKDDKLKTVIDRINVRYLKEKGNIENYLTGILCKINEDSVDFVNAGHSMPVLFSEESQNVDFVKSESGQKAYGAIGLIGMPSNFISHTVQMKSGDELILFTDGVTDAQNINGGSFGKDRLIKSIQRNIERPLSTQINCITSDISNFSHGTAQQDDISILILKKK